MKTKKHQVLSDRHLGTYYQKKKNKTENLRKLTEARTNRKRKELQFLKHAYPQTAL